MIRSSRWPGRGRTVVALGVAAFIAFGVVAMAAEDDRTATEALLREVEASPWKGAGGELTARSRAALERGAHLRSSGDEAHAKIADRLARTWAEAARDVVRAAAAEESASSARRSATDAGALADRERALLEEAIAQSGRLRAQLATASRETNEPHARTSAVAASVDAGARAPARPDAPAKPSATGADGGVR